VHSSIQAGKTCLRVKNLLRPKKEEANREDNMGTGKVTLVKLDGNLEPCFLRGEENTAKGGKIHSWGKGTAR